MRQIITQPDIVNHDKTVERRAAPPFHGGMTLGKRITQARKAIPGLTQAKLAEAASVGQSTVAQWETGKNEPSLADIRKIAAVTKQSAEWLAFGVEAPSGGIPDDFALVPVYDVRAAAGAGAVNHNEAPISRSAFRLDWLHRVTTAPPDRLAVIQVAGDSMEPTLHHGDHVLIDRTVTRWTRDGLYVMRYDVSDEVMVKRLEWNAGPRTFTIRSDNRAYGEKEVPADQVIIVGRVLWLGRNVG